MITKLASQPLHVILMASDKKPEKARDKTPKKRYTNEDLIREAKAFLEKMKRRDKKAFCKC